jgi:hypothetical protein
MPFSFSKAVVDSISSIMDQGPSAGTSKCRYHQKISGTVFASESICRIGYTFSLTEQSERTNAMNPEDQRSLEQVYRSAVSGLYARLKSNYDFLFRKFGKDGLKLIEEMSREYGVSVAHRAKAKLPNGDLFSVAGYLIRIFETVARGQNLTSTIEESEDRVVIRVDRCPLHFDNPEMCRAHTTMEKTVVEELNPDLTYRIGKSIPCGDGFCEHIIEVKKWDSGLTNGLHAIK